MNGHQSSLKSCGLQIFQHTVLVLVHCCDSILLAGGRDDNDSIDTILKEQQLVHRVQITDKQLQCCLHRRRSKNYQTWAQLYMVVN